MRCTFSARKQPDQCALGNFGSGFVVDNLLHLWGVGFQLQNLVRGSLGLFRVGGGSCTGRGIDDDNLLYVVSRVCTRKTLSDAT